MIIFAREPQKGKVKTRLKDFFSSAQLLNLYKAFLKDTLDLAKNINCEAKILAFFSTRSPQYLKKIAGDFAFYKQRGKDLGERMHNAFVYARKNNAEKTVIIGSDSPDLPLKNIRRAFRKLDNHDVVLGPTYDGGYYLIGLREPNPDLFKRIKWGSEYVFEHTVNRARRLNKRIFILDKWHDVDGFISLKNLICRLKKNRNAFRAKWTKSTLFHLTGGEGVRDGG